MSNLEIQMMEKRKICLDYCFNCLSLVIYSATYNDKAPVYVCLCRPSVTTFVKSYDIVMEICGKN